MIRLDRDAPFDISDEAEQAELMDALGEGIMLIFHQSGAVFQCEGGTFSEGNVRLVTPARSEVIKMMDSLGISDECPLAISAGPKQ